VPQLFFLLEIKSSEFDGMVLG